MNQIVLNEVRLLALALVLFAFAVKAGHAQNAPAAPAAAMSAIAGAGALAPGQVYEGWALAYGSKYGVVLEYKRVGGVQGVRDTIDRKADFGASELPLRGIELERAGLAQIPTYVTALVPVVNLSGMQAGTLRLTGPLLAEIFLGRVKKWNDKAIRELNPTLSLPDLDIQVLYRSDETAHTQVLTRYLSKVSDTWAKQVGAGNTVQWRTGIGTKGGEAMISEIKRVAGAIGYVEVSQAQLARMTTVQLQNLFGRFVSPDMPNLLAAADSADWELMFAGRSSFDIDLTDMPGLRAWPITAASYVVLPRTQEWSERARRTLAFFDWSLGVEGDEIAEKLGYVGLPARGKHYVRASLRRNFTDGRGEPLLR